MSRSRSRFKDVVARWIAWLFGHAERRRSVPEASLYCIYRAENAHVVTALVEPFLTLGWPVHLWALDARAEALDNLTRGSGPGRKFELANTLIEQHPPRPSDAVLLADDDIAVTSGRLTDLLRWMHAGGFDVAQPAHRSTSNTSHPVTVAVKGARARVTGFVEVGPLFVIAARARETLLPFPADAGMGWGLDLLWSTLPGRRLGVIDAVTVDHLGEVAVAYSRQEELETMREFLTRHGTTLDSWRGATYDTWWAHHRRPRGPWPKGGRELLVGEHDDRGPMA